eukprot:COSAG05_NODE_5147_length_1252_cov_10.757155_1_plen_313_part_10
MPAAGWSGHYGLRHTWQQLDEAKRLQRLFRHARLFMRVLGGWEAAATFRVRGRWGSGSWLPLSPPWLPTATCFHRGMCVSPPPPSYAAYQHLCALLESQPAHLAKTATIKLALPKWDSQLELLIRMLLPASDQRTFRLQDRGLIKVLSRVYGADANEMRQHMEQCGDVSETAAAFYPGNATGAPNAVVPLGLADVDGVLNELARVSRQDAQAAILGRFVQTTTGASDVKWLCRLLKKDLKTRAKEKLVLSALHPGAYDVFKNRSDILAVVAWARSQPPHFTSSADDAVGATTSMADNTTIVTPGQPVKPMLAR